MKRVVSIETKQTVEFGADVILYRAVDSTDPKCSTLWHRDPETAMQHWARKRSKPQNDADAAVAATLMKNKGMTETEAVAETKRLAERQAAQVWSQFEADHAAEIEEAGEQSACPCGRNVMSGCPDCDDEEVAAMREP